MIKNVLEKTELIFSLALILPLLFAFDLNNWKFLIDILLGLVMFFSVRPLLKQKKSDEKILLSTFISIFLNYIILSAVIIFLAAFLIEDRDLFFGFLVIAMTPPAISIIPFSYLCNGDTKTGIAAIFFSYFIGLMVMPVSLLWILGSSIDMFVLLRILLILIVVPFIIAYFLRNAKFKLFDWSKAFVNLFLGIAIVIGMSMNRAAFFSFDSSVFYMFLIHIIGISLIGWLSYFIFKRFTTKRRAINYSLFSSYKNLGSAITISIFLISPKAAVPAIIGTVVQFVNFIVFKWIVGKNRIDTN